MKVGKESFMRTNSRVKGPAAATLGPLGLLLRVDGRCQVSTSGAQDLHMLSQQHQDPAGCEQAHYHHRGQVGGAQGVDQAGEGWALPQG